MNLDVSRTMHRDCNRIVTEHETAVRQALRMAERDDDTETGAGADAEALPDLNPWRQVGWIFRENGCVAIERRGQLTRHRVLAD